MKPHPIDFSVHLTGPTGAFKTELAALAQAHFGAAFNGRRLPASWADTANMLEKKAFLAKDAVLVVDDFAPTGTTADVQRLHREADRLFRAAGNRSGRARMRADGGSGPPTTPRGLIISTGEDIPERPEPAGAPPGARADPGRHRADRPLGERRPTRRRGFSLQAMAGYLRWLAPHIDELQETLPSGSGPFATRSSKAAASRTPDIRGQPDPELGDVPGLRRRA